MSPHIAATEKERRVPARQSALLNGLEYELVTSTGTMHIEPAALTVGLPGTKEAGQPKLRPNSSDAELLLDVVQNFAERGSQTPHSPEEGGWPPANTRTTDNNNCKVNSPTQANGGLEWGTRLYSDSEALAWATRQQPQLRIFADVEDVASHLSVERRDAKVGHPSA